MFSDRFANVASPLVAGTVVVPLSVLAPGLTPRASDTFAVLVVRLPKVSSIRTVTAGAMLAAAGTFEGWLWNVSFVAGPAPTLKLVLVADVSAGLVAAREYPTALLSIERLANVATPLTAAPVVVPVRTPPAGLVTIAMVTFAVLVVRFPAASSIRTVMAGAMARPAVVFDGC